MSLITRCPACGTMFKVVPDQLRISEGWVRCGHCSDVFNASVHLQRDDEPLTEDDLQPPVEPPPEPPQVVASPRNTPPIEPPPATPEPVAAPIVAAEEVPARAAVVTEPVAPDARPANPRRQAEAEEPGDAVTHADVSFVRQARRKAFWQRPLVRVGLGLAGLLLLAALLGQVAVQERDRIAATEPALKPWLQALCQPLGCTVGPLRQIEAVVIDGSSFNRLRGDSYRFGLTLRNQAPLPIAMPAIELTLTDGQDQPVVRRVLTPADLGVASGQIGAAADWSGTFALNVASGSGVGRVAGYRVLAFYP